MWSTIFHARTGRFIYPFMDTHKPFAWVGYVGMYALVVLASLLVLVVVWAREGLLARHQLAVPKTKAS